MFRKIVTNLPFSPALVGQLGFYANRLKKEEATRRLGLIFTALALIVQSLTVFTPPQAANAASPADFISGGVKNKADFLAHYDNNTNGIKGLFTSLGITRDEVAAMSQGKIKAAEVDGKYNWSRTSLYSHAQGQRSYTFNNGSGPVTFYSRPLALTQEGSLPYPVLEGKSATFGYFAIKMDCGNLISKKQPPEPKPAVACTRLKVEKIDTNRYKATAHATVSDTVISKYRFAIEGRNEDKTVETSETSASVEFSKSAPDTYTVRAHVKAAATGEVTSPECKDTFTIPKPETPWANCLAVTPTITNLTTVSLTGTAEAGKGATIKRYTYVVKDSSGTVVRTIVKDSTATSHTVDAFTLATPGTYSVVLTIDTSVGARSGGSCSASFTIPPPVATPFAACVTVRSSITNRTLVSLSGDATVGNGATVSKYTFNVKDAKGRVVHTTTVDTPALTATANSFTLNRAGSYTVTLSVTTSQGEKSGPTCEAPLTIVPPNVCAYNPKLPESSPDCQPCPGTPSLWIKDERCASKIINTKTVKNMTQGNVNATTVTAKAGDRLSYLLTVENRGLAPEKVTIKEELGDVLEYAELTHLAGGTFDAATKTLSWSDVEVKPGEKQTREIVAQVLGSIPSTNTGASNGASYDCVITNTFGNTVTIGMDCPAQKIIIEQVVKELPSTGPTENMIFAGIVGAVVTFFYARSRQLAKEVRLVRKDFNMGTI